MQAAENRRTNNLTQHTDMQYRYYETNQQPLIHKYHFQAGARATPRPYKKYNNKESPDEEETD